MNVKISCEITSVSIPLLKNIVNEGIATYCGDTVIINEPVPELVLVKYWNHGNVIAVITKDGKVHRSETRGARQVIPNFQIGDVILEVSAFWDIYVVFQNITINEILLMKSTSVENAGIPKFLPDDGSASDESDEIKPTDDGIESETENTGEIDWKQKIAEAYTEAFGHDHSQMVGIMEDGTITGTMGTGESYYCKSHGMNEPCSHCIVYLVHGWYATDIPYIYNDDGEIEKSDFVYDREAKLWIENSVGSFADEISSWANEEEPQLLANLREVIS